MHEAKAVLRILGQGPGDRRADPRPAAAQIGLRLRVLQQQLPAVLAAERQASPVSSSWKTMARLYWSQCRLSLPRNSSGAAYSGVTAPICSLASLRAGQAVDQAEVGDLDVIADRETGSAA